LISLSPGKEPTLVTQNPWNSLGNQTVEDACLLFDRHAFAAAAGVRQKPGKRRAIRLPAS
jgi:hypothetical protein